MNILVLGNGAREHALCYAIAKSQKLTRLFCAPGNYGILVLNGQVQLLGSNLVSEIDKFSGGDSVSGADSTHTHASQEKAIDVPSKFGPNISWNKLVSQFGYIRDGISQLKLLASVHTAYGDDVLTEISGTIALSSTDDSVLLFTVDSDTCLLYTSDAADE